MRTYSREFRIEVVKRILGGEKVPALSRELGIHRKLLYEWMRRVRAGGEANLRQRGRPKKSEPIVSIHSAARQIAELEREVAYQQLVIGFFKIAFERIQSSTPAHQRESRAAIFQTIQEMNESPLSVETMCELAGVGRSAYYRYLRNRDP